MNYLITSFRENTGGAFLFTERTQEELVKTKIRKNTSEIKKRDVCAAGHGTVDERL